MNSPTKLRVLILENEAVIAMEVEEVLEEAGLVVAGTLSSCAAALEWLKNQDNDLDVALLDMHLNDGSCERVAERLRERSVPFVVVSGRSRGDEFIDPVFVTARWLEKPAAPDRIVAAVFAAAADRLIARA